MGKTPERLHDHQFAAWIERQLARQLAAKLRGMVEDAYPRANDRVRQEARWMTTGLAEEQARLFQHELEDDDAEL